MLVESKLARPSFSMEFKIAITFLFLYYIRPQDWVQSLVGFNIIRPMIIIWVGALFATRDRSPLPGVFKTPHDWLILIYFLYCVWNAPDPNSTFSAFLPLVVFYGLTVQSLTNWNRLLFYIKAWNWMLLGVAFMAVASLYGLDLTGAVDVTAQNVGRLSIGTWLHNNPNSLAHSVVAAIPLSYLLYFWRGSAGGRMIIFPLFAALAIYCAYCTESKGSYLVAGGLVALVFVIGRPIGVKVIILAMALTMGVSALSFLPRMSQMGNLRADEGVQGRLMAWEMAREVSQKEPTGQGWKQFQAWITWEGETFPKATHSSYVQIGGDLGVYGLFLFAAGIWLSMHTLISAHRFTKDDDSMERVRRCAMIIVIAYAASSWMINREYHTEYFLMIGIAAAIHRHCLAQSALTRPEERRNDGEINQDPVTAKAAVRLSQGLDGRVLPTIALESADDEIKPFWKKAGLLDAGASILITWSILWGWDYILENL